MNKLRQSSPNLFGDVCENSMKVSDCFTMDIRFNKKESSIFNILKMFLTDKSYKIIALFRLSEYFRNIKFGLFGKALAKLILMRLRNRFAVEFGWNAKIGRGIKLYHPCDIVFGGGCILGENVTVYNGVTFGARSLEDSETIKSKDELYNLYPKIGDGLVIYTGAKIIGGFVIGRNSVVGANSVVIRSFKEENSIIAGVPAKLIS